MSKPAPTVLERLTARLGDLTLGQRRIADRLMGDPHAAAFWGVEDLAKAAGVSVASVVRFAQALGFGGFLELRQALVAEAKERGGAEDRLLQAPQGAAATLVEVARRDVANIERTVSQIHEALLTEAVAALSRARHRVLLGRGVSQHMAELLGYLLAQAGLPAVSGSAADFAFQVANLGPEDLAVVFSVHPYSRETIEAASFAKRRGVQVLAFTDRLEAPVASVADVVLPVAGENLMYSHSLAAFAVVAHTLATAVASRDREGALKRIREAERVARTQFT